MRTSLRSRRVTFAEQVSRAGSNEKLSTICAQSYSLALEDLDRGGALQAIEGACKSSLPRADGPRVARAQAHDLPSAARRIADIECPAGERIADANVPIQVRKRSDA